MPQTTQPTAGKSGPTAPYKDLTPTEREQIARRARAIWREEGCPDGRDRAHWEMAELQVLKARGSS